MNKSKLISSNPHFQDLYKTCYKLLQGIVMQQGGVIKVDQRCCDIIDPKLRIQIDYDTVNRMYIISIPEYIEKHTEKEV